MKRVNLRIPGPTPCPEEVLEAVGRQMVNHRGPEFRDLLKRVSGRLKTVFQTENDVLIFTTSGTGGLEAAIVNTLSPGDHVLALTCGEFGDRFFDIAEAFGATVSEIAVAPGRAVDPRAVDMFLRSVPGVKAVLVTHNETSTGVTNDLQAIAQVVRAHGALLLVDAVSSMGAIEVKTDEWGLDVVVSASQKGWMVPPGLAMVSVSERAGQAYAEARMPRFYFDFAKAKRSLEKGETPWTPAVSILYGLDVAIAMMLDEGLENIYERHQYLAERTRSGVLSLGLQLFADDHYSNTVTAVKAPEGKDASDIIRRLREDHGVVVAGGQGKLSGKIFRVAHLGWVDGDEIDHALRALGIVLQK
jgi:aspartate aminotransferase-like enzyme